MNVGQDSDFTREQFLVRYNSELANNLGNLVNRTLNMTTRFAAGVLPPAEVTEEPWVPFQDRVRLTTVHQAKGLEFDVVFVIMMCDGLFPNVRALNAEDGEEEERRLFYVAITRARRALIITWNTGRQVMGDYPAGAFLLLAGTFVMALLKFYIRTKANEAFVRTGAEECDDGNTVQTDACLNTCKSAKCGDAVVRAGALPVFAEIDRGLATAPSGIEP